MKSEVPFATALSGFRSVAAIRKKARFRGPFEYGEVDYRSITRGALFGESACFHANLKLNHKQTIAGMACGQVKPLTKAHYVAAEFRNQDTFEALHSAKLDFIEMYFRGREAGRMVQNELQPHGSLLHRVFSRTLQWKIEGFGCTGLLEHPWSFSNRAMIPLIIAAGGETVRFQFHAGIVPFSKSTLYFMPPDAPKLPSLESTRLCFFVILVFRTLIFQGGIE